MTIVKLPLIKPYVLFVNSIRAWVFYFVGIINTNIQNPKSSLKPVPNPMAISFPNLLNLNSPSGKSRLNLLNQTLPISVNKALLRVTPLISA